MENRAVLHTALRAKESAVIKVNDKNIVPEIYEVKE
jgi:glucose-6-phosphate isomerase